MRASSPMSHQTKNNIISCEIHVGNHITHFCCLPTCLIPLCSKCIKNHNQLHKNEGTYSEIESIDDIKEFCQNRIKSSISNYTKEIEKLNLIPKGKTNENEEAFAKIKKSKVLLLNIIDSFYQELEDHYIKKVANLNHNSDSDESNIIADKLRKIIDKLEKLNISINNRDTLYTIKSILLRDLDEEYEQMKFEINKEMGNMNGNRPNQFVIDIDDNRLKNIYQELEQFVIISDQFNNSTAKQINSLTSSKQAHLTPGKVHNDIQVNCNDYFDPNVYKKYIHFFQHKSKNLHLLDLDLVEQENVCEFERVELNIDFKIPRWHRSLVTPFSEIYLTGGVDINNSEIKLKKSYVYDFNNKALIEIDNMNFGRSGHAMIYLNGYIYTLGGFSDEREFTDKCERYNIRKNIWEIIASMKVKSNNPCACSFRGKYIYKFGGKVDDNQLSNSIERYSPLIDKWNLIEFELPKEYNYATDGFSILSSSACIQVNQNQIFVFGGTYADYSQKSAQSFFLTVEEKDEDQNIRKINESSSVSCYHKIKDINEYPLPVAEGFWNNQVFVNNKKLYCLQNVQNEKNNSVVYLDRRRALEFESNEGWRMLN